jgi:hypothetical protein
MQVRQTPKPSECAMNGAGLPATTEFPEGLVEELQKQAAA